MKKSSSNLKWMFFMLLLAAAMPVFSQDILPPGLTTLAEGILEIFTGGFARIILIICFCGCALAYGFNKDNEKIKRNSIAIGASAAILAIAGTVVDKIMAAARG